MPDQDTTVEALLAAFEDRRYTYIDARRIFEKVAGDDFYSVALETLLPLIEVSEASLRNRLAKRELTQHPVQKLDETCPTASACYAAFILKAHYSSLDVDLALFDRVLERAHGQNAAQHSMDLLTVSIHSL